MKKTAKGHTTILIRGLSESQNVILKKIREIFSEPTNSKAVLMAIRSFVELKEEYHRLSCDYEELMGKYEALSMMVQDRIRLEEDIKKMLSKEIAISSGAGRKC